MTLNPLNIHGVALGTFPLSNVFGKVTAEEAAQIVNLYLDNGYGYIQTAPYYQGVDSLMQKILAGVPRDSYCLGTLCVKDRDSNLAGSRKAIFAQCDDSLKHLGVEYIDLYLTSTPRNEDVPYGETIEAMQELQEAGKIRQIGVCNVTLDELKEYNATGAVKYVQNRFSLLDQEQDQDVRAYCVEHGIGLIPYNVIEWGLLTDKSLQNWELRKDDLRTEVLPVFEGSPKQAIHEWATKYLQPLAKAKNTTVEALAIHWVLSQPGVATALVGATKPEQLRSSLQATDLSSKDLVGELDAAYKAFSQDVQAKSGLSVNDFLKNSFGKW